MKIRTLEKKDAEYMLEWMHDSSVTADLNTDFERKTIEDCEAFIEASWADTENCHFAIVDEKDEYMGTVSLKHIDAEHKEAEFAIAIRKTAMGKGLSSYGMKSIIRYGLEKLDLDRIYWYVSKNNHRAVRFYDKNGFLRIGEPMNRWTDQFESDLSSYYWYVVNKG